VFSTQRRAVTWTIANVLLAVTFVMAGALGDEQGSIDGMTSTQHESNPNVIDSGGGIATSAKYMTVASIGQPMIGEASSSMYSNETGFFTTEKEKVEVTRILVTNTNDSGEGSLRWAIDWANNNAGPDSIIFNIPETDPGYDPGSGAWTIAPLAQLPYLFDDGTVIDGASQATFIGADTNPYGPEIEISGAEAGDANGLYITSSLNVIQSLVINGFQSEIWTYGRGIEIEGSDVGDNIIVGCYIGTDATGMTAVGNRYNGIAIRNGSSGNRIGGPTPAERNIICGAYDYVNVVSGCGISIGHIGLGANNDNNIIQGNFIGVNREGNGVLGNDNSGILIYKGRGNRIGGTGENEGNVIAGNGSAGVYIHSLRSTNNTVAGNFIGTDVTGMAHIGNSTDGIRLTNGASGNVIGPGNIIAHNDRDGVRVVEDTTTGNTVTRNSIYDNDQQGINTVSGGNTELAPPVITSVTETEVSGTACSDCIVEIFSDADDEGETYEGTVTADGSGSFTLAVTVTGPFVTATATDGDGNTSEFSSPYAFSVCERGDVNCDGNITPGDALCAFWRAILGSFQEECDCDCSEQSAEINCDGVITPGDALCIFWRAILGDWPDDCQCPTAKAPAKGPAVDHIEVASIHGLPGQTVTFPLFVENPRNFDAFALQITYSDDVFTFASISATRATDDWIVLEGVELQPGSVMMGGFNSEGICSQGLVPIVELRFSIRDDATGQGRFEISHLADDLKGAHVKTGGLTIREMPTTFSLSQNYPNPFNPTTNIQYAVVNDQTTHHSQLVTLKIYNLLGQDVRTLVDDVQEAGYHTVSWDGSDNVGCEVPSGIYFYRLAVGQYSETKRMVLIK
jgi:hypothetical protein